MNTFTFISHPFLLLVFFPTEIYFTTIDTYIFQIEQYYYSLCKSIRSEFLVNIFGYIHDITILTKDLCLGINYLHFLFFVLNDPLVTYHGTQTIQTKIFHFYSLSAHNDIEFNVLYDILTF